MGGGCQVVSAEEGALLARQYFGGMPFFETSAKLNQNIEPMFLRIVTDVKIKMMAELYGGPGSESGIRLPGGKGTTSARRGCC